MDTKSDETMEHTTGDKPKEDDESLKSDYTKPTLDDTTYQHGSREEDAGNPTKGVITEKLPTEGASTDSMTNVLYATQNFHFTPASFSDGVYNALQLYTWEALEAAQTLLQREFGDLITAKVGEVACKELMSKMTESFERAFDRLELFLTNEVFYVPSNMVLLSDKVQVDFPDAEKMCGELEEEICALKDQIKAECTRTANLKQELGDASVVQAELDKTLQYITELSNIFSAEKMDSLKYVCEKTQQLKACLEYYEQMPDTKKQKSDEIHQLS